MELLHLIDTQFTEAPFYGSHQMACHLRRLGHVVNRHKRVRRLQRLMSREAILRHPRTSDPHPEHKVFPYLMRGM